jgi:hypothetical protein
MGGICSMNCVNDLLSHHIGKLSPLCENYRLTIERVISQGLIFAILRL